jgi:hypothetical protein
VLGGGVAVLRMARLAKLAHLGRHVNHLRGITALRLPVRSLQRRSAPTVAVPLLGMPRDVYDRARGKINYWTCDQ